ncbi:unnamed protein product [Pylaiella littoralis]
MDLLKAELERKKQRTSELVAKAGGEKGGRRFVRRGEAVRLEKEERVKNQTDLIRLRQEKKRKREEEERKKEEEEEQRRKKTSAAVSKQKEQKSDAAKEKEKAAAVAAEKQAAAAAQEDEVPAKEAKARLRALCLPITLFGETQAQRSARLLLAEEDKGHHQDDFTLADGHNVNNEFLGNVSADLSGSHLDAATGRDEEPTAGDREKGDDSDDDDDDDDDDAGTRAARQATRTAKGRGGGAQDGDSGGGSRGSGDAAGSAAGGGEKGAGEGGVGDEAKLDGEVKEMERNKLVRTFFRGLLKEWEMDLNVRPDHVKRTVQGKLETKTQKQAKDYMRPLFKLCKQKALPDGILNNLVTMINFMKEGEFVRANDIYLLTAIGNAPWPIGLTMVGIHERSGRERISSKNVAHIMNNEAQRKYLVSVKRLMTYLQDKRTDIAPSKKVR